MREGWVGFNGRKFLTAQEYETYRKRLPVRYTATGAPEKPVCCEVCGSRETASNPLQAAHKIPFAAGVLKYGLTPDYLDAPENVVWAHRVKCNSAAKLTHAQIEVLVRDGEGNAG